MYKPLLDQYISYKQKEIEILMTMPDPVFKVLPIHCGRINEEIENWTQIIETSGVEFGTPVIYFFKIVNFDNVNSIPEMVKKLKLKRTSKNYLALPRVNDSTSKTSDILYVGKTNSNFLSRFKGHLGLGSRITYSLQLVHWACKMNLELELHYAPLIIEVSALRHVEEMESVLHYHFSPILGRSGH